MNNIFSILLVCLLINQTYAQPKSFLDHTWKVAEQSIEYKDRHIHNYHKDSLVNLFDYSGLSFRFLEDGTYERQEGDTTYKGTYKIYSEADSIEIDDNLYYLAALTDDKVIIRSIMLQLSEDLSTLDTAYVYLSLYPFVITGIYNGTAADILLYPNPSIDELRVESASQTTTIGQIRMLTVYGSLLSTTNGSDQAYISINTSNLPEGIYIIEVLDKRNNRICIKKFSKKQ